jgi:predicted protein tyrosine phosphatase
MAADIIKFIDIIQASPKKMVLLIHCTAGISRSGAIGEVISDYLGKNYKEFKQINPQILPNSYVKKIMKNVIDEKTSMIPIQTR